MTILRDDPWTSAIEAAINRPTMLRASELEVGDMVYLPYPRLVAAVIEVTEAKGRTCVTGNIVLMSSDGGMYKYAYIANGWHDDPIFELSVRYDDDE